MYFCLLYLYFTLDFKIQRNVSLSVTHQIYLTYSLIWTHKLFVLCVCAYRKHLDIKNCGFFHKRKKNHTFVYLVDYCIELCGCTCKCVCVNGQWSPPPSPHFECACVLSVFEFLICFNTTMFFVCCMCSFACICVRSFKRILRVLYIYIFIWHLTMKLMYTLTLWCAKLLFAYEVKRKKQYRQNKQFKQHHANSNTLIWVVCSTHTDHCILIEKC